MNKRDESLHVLQHALGLDDYGRGNPYRNRFVTSDGTEDWPLCMAHVEAGRMQRREPHEIFGGDYCFTVTDAGREFVRLNSPRLPKVSRSKRAKLCETSENGPKKVEPGEEKILQSKKTVG